MSEPEALDLDYSALRAEAHDLIDLAAMLGPEGEGVDLSDRGYDTISDLVALRAVLGTMYRAIQIVNAGLAQVWAGMDRYGKADYGGLEYSIGVSRKTVFQPNAAIEFAKWLKDQEPELIERIVSIYGVRLTPLPPRVRDSFIESIETDDRLRIKTKKPR